jgi:deazaflavin-dependent oxidoreductase (nitroreductase family)
MTFDRSTLAAQRTIDLTTRGRRSGRPRRVEIWWFHVEGRFIITGTPGRRDWLANIHADESVVIHVNGEDLPARAVPVDDLEFRRRFFTRPSTSWYSTQSELDHLVATAPMVEILFQD